LIKLIAVPPESVEPIWKRIGPDFDRAASHTRKAITADSIKVRALAGHCTIWIVADDADTEVTAACATSKVALPGGLRILFVEALAGKKRNDVFEFRATLERHAASEGCDQVMFILPRGMARGNPLPDYRASHYLMSKEL
jgi:hypothetical protein